MTRIKRLHRILGLQSHLVATELAMAEQELAGLARQQQVIWTVLAELAPPVGVHNAQYLSAGADLAERLLATRRQLQWPLAELEGKVAGARRRRHQVERQRDRLTGVRR